MENRDALKLWKWTWPYTEFHTSTYMHIHVFWTVYMVSECETGHQTGHSKLGLWASIKVLLAYWPCNGLWTERPKCFKWQIMLRSQLLMCFSRQQEIFGKIMGKKQRVHWYFQAVLSFNCSHLQGNYSCSQGTRKMTAPIHFATKTSYCDQSNHLICQRIFPLSKCCYVFMIYKVFSTLE